MCECKKNDKYQVWSPPDDPAQALPAEGRHVPGCYDDDDDDDDDDDNAGGDDDDVDNLMMTMMMIDFKQIVCFVFLGVRG